MKILRIILYVIASIILVGVVAFLFLSTIQSQKSSPLERKAISEEQIDKRARDLVDQMTLEEKVQMMTPILKSNLKAILEILSDE
jgi:uncharacterized membrane protein affecting hemolysin expression